MKDFEIIPKTNMDNLPKTFGVYAFFNDKNLIYIGKSINIRERVKNHFKQPSYKDNFFTDKVNKIGFLKTGSEIEALLLESNLIKKYQPKFNVIWRDDKNFFYVAIEKNDKGLPFIYLTHQPNLKTKSYKLQVDFIGPFVEGAALKKVLKYLRRPFPYYTSAKPSAVVLRARHPKIKCTWCHLDLCPGPDPDILQYKKNIKNLILVLKGKKSSVISRLKKEMILSSKTQNYERAAKIRDQISSLENIFSHNHIINQDSEVRDSAIYQLSDLLGKKVNKIECYDISNIHGKQATGSMIVSINGQPEKSLYRKFKIKLNNEPNDIAMLKEVFARRFSHPEWIFPDAILIDGGKAQLNAGIEIKNNLKIKNLKVLSIAKGKQELFIEGKKNPIPLKDLPQEIYNLIKLLDDEAHRFAINYHRALRKKYFL